MIFLLTGTMPVPLLETLIDGHPDVEVDLGLGDVVAGEQLTQAAGVLLQHVAVVLPAAALREHLQRAPRRPVKPKSFSQTDAHPPSAAQSLTPGLRYPTSPVFPSL